MEEDRELFERLRGFTVPELCDGAGLFNAMDYRIKPWIGRTKIVGRALTVKVLAGEGAIVTKAIEQAGEGGPKGCRTEAHGPGDGAYGQADHQDFRGFLGRV